MGIARVDAGNYAEDAQHVFDNSHISLAKNYT